MKKPERARKRKPDTARVDLQPLPAVLQGRVSTSKWNPKEYQGVCGWHDTEEQGVTSGDRSGLRGGAG